MLRGKYCYANTSVAGHLKSEPVETIAGLSRQQQDSYFSLHDIADIYFTLYLWIRAIKAERLKNQIRKDGKVRAVFVNYLLFEVYASLDSLTTAPKTGEFALQAVSHSTYLCLRAMSTPQIKCPHIKNRRCYIWMFYTNTSCKVLNHVLFLFVSAAKEMYVHRITSQCFSSGIDVVARAHVHADSLEIREFPRGHVSAV
uniref:DUF1738 domain-containing protein n=1 Tax=Steinernema glaseri TaxID=37863 RepID=A0A1I7Z9I4_9BILA